jgi:hypothetical protein
MINKDTATENRLFELKSEISPIVKQLKKIKARIDELDAKKDKMTVRESSEYTKKVSSLTKLKEQLSPLQREEFMIIEAHTTERKNEYEYNSYEYTVSEINKRYLRSLDANFDVDDTFAKGAIYVPDYQRDFVWALLAQSKFIESLILGIPVPLIFFADVNSHLEIVDGSQRIRTLHHFLEGGLRLQGLEKLTYLNGYTYDELPVQRQNRIDDISLRAVSLGQSTISSARYDLFERVNTGGNNLKSAEERKGSVVSEFSEFINECSENKLFQSLCPLGDKVASRGEAIERVTRFFAYSGEGSLNNYQGTVAPFLKAYLKTTSSTFDKTQRIQMETKFNNMLNFVQANFPLGFRKFASAKSTFRVRFEAIAIGVSNAIERNPTLTVDNIDWINSEEFITKVRSDAANNKSKLTGRIEYVTQQLLGE